MADPIDPDLMKAILARPAWAMAVELGDTAVSRIDRFAVTPPPPPALVVPVDVQALYVPEGHDEGFVRLPMELGGPASDTDTPVPPFSALEPRPAGIHLHWAMPDGLLGGDLADGDAPLTLRALPNRWLVVRMTGPEGSRRLALRAWVIASETGRVWDLDQFPDGDGTGDGDQVAPEALDGVIGGSPGWTAGYDATRNRFAFHDPLDDIDPDRITTKLASYVVVGWWSERTNDPLSKSYWPLSVSRTLDELGWIASPAPFDGARPLTPTRATPTVARTFSRRASADPERPSVAGSARLVDTRAALSLGTAQAALLQGYDPFVFDAVALPVLVQHYDTLMHGSVNGVRITGPVGRDLAPRTPAMGIALAPTLERLIAAQVAEGLRIDDPRQREYTESLLTAVANGAIRRLGERDGIIALDEAEHGDGFEAFRGREEYEDVIVERRQSDLGAGRPLRTKAASLASPKPVAAQVMWLGSKAGTKTAGMHALRRTAQETIDARFRNDTPGVGPTTRRVKRPGPRYHRAVPPVVGLRDFGRSDRFEDRRFSRDGRLRCRWARELATSFGRRYDARDYVPALSNDALPAQTRRILEHSFLLDAYMYAWSAQAIEQTVPAELVPAVDARLRAEIALRYSQDGTYDGAVPIARSDTRLVGAALDDELLRFSLAEGREPSPVGITNWSQPWLPVWLEWEARLEPGRDLEGWSLGRIEFEGRSVPSGRSLVVRGRAPITSGLHDAWQGMIRDYLIAENQRDQTETGEISEAHEARLAQLGAYLETADLGSVTLDQMGDVWLGLESAPDGQERPAPDDVAADLRAAGLPRLIASGQMSLVRARIVDCFGRVRDLNTDRLVRPVALAVEDGQGRPAVALPPRLSLPARLMFRLVDPADTSSDPREASLNQADPTQGINPVAGYLLPDFIDESVELFDAKGAPLGEILHDAVTGGLVWEGAVGRPGPAVSDPEEGLPPAAQVLGRIARGMIDADARRSQDPATADEEPSLSAFLRAVDTTMWGVDESQTHAGASIAGLVGRPVAVVRATLWLDIPTKLADLDAFGETADGLSDLLTREGVFEAVKTRAFGVALGEIAKGHDGLYGYFLGDDFSRFRLIEKSVRDAAPASGPGKGFRAIIGSASLSPPSPLESAYIDAGGRISVHSGQKVQLTLLMHPAGRVHATTGILPRKSIELLRDWVAPGLERIAPSARIGPVLIDPDKVRLPKIAAFGKDQRWTRRASPITWRDDPILAATQAAILPDGPVSVEEGWIRIGPDGEDSGGVG